MANDWVCSMIASGLSSAECASWVQAWGSIFAIFAAVFVVVLSHWLQLRAKRKEQSEEYTTKLVHTHHLIWGTVQVARAIVEFSGTGMPGQDDRRAMLAEVSAYSDALRMVDKSQLDSIFLLRAVLAGDALARKLRDDLDVTFHERLGQNLQSGWLRTQAEALKSQLDEHAETIAIAVRERRGLPRTTGAA